MFNPTLSKEQLQAAFNWHVWENFGIGRELTVRQMVYDYSMMGLNGIHVSTHMWNKYCAWAAE